MQKLAKDPGVAAIAGAASFSMTSAQAWWGGGPWGGPGYGSGWGDGMTTGSATCSATATATST
jgi:hypothetical protein